MWVLVTVKRGFSQKQVIFSPLSPSTHLQTHNHTHAPSKAILHSIIIQLTFETGLAQFGADLIVGSNIILG